MLNQDVTKKKVYIDLMNKMFALAEATGLFAIMIAFLVLYS